MKKYRKQRSKTLVTALSALAVLAGLGLLGYSLFGGTAASAPEIGTVKTGLIGAPEKPVAQRDTNMTLTVPKMARVNDVPVYTAPASDEATLDRGTMHVEGTGFPWETGSNVYIAGHRLGYRNTGSYLQFYDLPKLKKGDEIILTGADGTTYTYEVFRKFRVDPSNYSVTQPVPGKSIVSLQTCTLPYYTQRLIVQGELVSVS
ncbi:MAG TPA: class E sortase [Rubrobacteraceae bacterium]|nr:class E sortase [Rubrobacteraceae bacterium]